MMVPDVAKLTTRVAPASTDPDAVTVSVTVPIAAVTVRTAWVPDEVRSAR